jgi:hypothetical protein
MMEKKPPLDNPLMIEKANRGANVVENGHIASIERAVMSNDTNRVFTAPIMSHIWPQRIRPTADEKLKAANSAAPTRELSPIDWP